MANVRVAVRVRPLSGKELDAGANNIISIHGNTLSITNVKVDGTGEYGDSSRDRVKHFTFDYCYDCSVDRGPHAHYASQELVYQDLGTEVLQAASDGYNACLFAYGQTGTGKTFTMMGYPGEIGLTPRICEGLFGYISERQAESVTFQVQISYMEIYNERVRDLLKVSSTHPERFTLRVREHPKEGPYVEDLSRHEVKDFHEVQTVLDRGNQNRTTAATHMHEHSSRSHAIVTLHFTQAKLEDGLPSEVVSKIHLVDLAGSERADPNYHKGRITEGASINKSLNTLANVIKALAERSLLAWSTETLGSATSCTNVGDPQPESPKVPSGRKSRHLYVPYRDSVLTWILKDSLGGNSKTVMIATVTPASKYYNETISTLRYAQRAKRIVNKPVVNEDANVSLIRQLRQEIERLKQLLASATGSSSPNPPLNEIMYFMPGMEKFLPYPSDMEAEEGGAGLAHQDPGTLLSEKLKENEAMANQLTQSWLNKWNETHSLMKESDLSIRGLGGRSSSYGVIIDSQLPHLIGMDDDILSTGVIIFHLKEGKTLIGGEDARREQDIVLEGPGIQAEHCHIQHEDGQVVLHPRQGAPCTLNGVLVNQPTALTQGDVLLLGQTSMYRFNNPAQAAKMRQHRQSQQDIQSLSAASSVTSLPDLQASRVLPLRMFNPNLESAQICLELEHKYANEAERIQHARTQLARVRAEVSEREEQDQEEEERLWEEHDQHWQQLQAERIGLTRLRERLLSSEEQAQELAQQQRQQLDQEDQLYKEQLQERLGQLTQNKGDDPVSHQTGESADTAAETAEDDDGSSAAPASAIIKGPAGQELRQRRSSLEGKIKGLAQSELLHSFKRRQAMESLQQRVSEVEEQMGQSRREVETRSHRVRQMEEQFRDADASKLERIRREKERLEELHRQEEQLELYLEEKQDLLAVGQALPKPLRGACSELSLLRQDSASDGFSTGTVRTANSEANIEQYQDDLDMGSVHSSSTSSRDSQDDSSGRFHSSGFLSGSAERFGRSQSLDDALGVGFEGRPGDGGGDLSRSVGSDMGSEESLSSSVDMSSSSSTSRQYGNQRVGEGRGRNKVRSGRGRPGTLHSPTPSKPEEKKLTARAAEVTSRLYKTKSSPSESLRRSARGKRDENAKSLSPDVGKPPSPHPSSKFHSPVSETTGRKDGVSNSELTTKRKGRNREEWDRPWRTKPESLSRSREDVEDKSVRSEPQDKGRDSWDRPWRHGRTAAEAGRHTRTLTVPRSPLALKKGASSSIPPPAAAAGKSEPASAKPKLRKDVSDVKGREIRKPKEPGIKRNIASLNVHSALHVSSAAKTPSSEKRVGSDKLPIKTRIPVKTGAKDTKPKIRDKTKTTGGHASRSNEELRSSRLSPVDRRQLSGSDSSLLVGRPHSRSRSWLRMVSSASSLPSVPEAAESESDHELAPLASEPSMAELVAAVPRRQRRGRRGLTEEEEERRHSEPVGEKWAEALAQYTADIETGLGREGLRRMDVISPASSQELTDNTQIIQSRESVPDVMIEDSPVCTDTDSSLESVEPENKADTCEQEEDVTPRPSDQAMLNTQTNVGTDNTPEASRSVDTTPIVTPRASDGQELKSSHPDVLLQQKSHADVDIPWERISSAAVMIVQPEFLGDTESDWCDVPSNIERKDSEGCFSTDSLDNSEHDPDSLSQDQLDSSNLAYDIGVNDEHYNVTDLDTVDVNGFSGVGLGDAGSLPFHEGHSQQSSGETQVPRAENSSRVSDLQNSELCKNVSDTGQDQDLRKDSLDNVGEKLDSGIPSAFADSVEASRSDRLQEVSQNNSLPESADFAESDSASLMQGKDTSVHVSTMSFTLGKPGLPEKGEEIVSPAEPTSKPTASTGVQPSHKSSGDQNEQFKTTTGQDSTPKPSEHNQVPHPDTEPTPARSEIPIEAARASAEGPEECEARSSRVSEVGSVPVEMLTWLAEEEGSQLSDEALSSSRVKEQIQAWQEVLQQLSPRTSGAVQGIGSAIGAAAHSCSGRRGKRRQHTRVTKGSDSDHDEHFSDDSLASGAHSHPSSRPGSGSRRRRRPANKPTETVVKKRRGHSSEEYVTSDNDSIFSDDSLTQSSERQETSFQVSDLRASVEQLASSLKSSEMAEAESDQLLKDESMEGDRKASVPVLVSYFESQMKHQQNDDSNGEQTPRERIPNRSPRSDEGNSSASEGTKTARVKGVMARAPICVLNAGDANNPVSDDVSKDVCETENIQEESNYRACPQQSWELSITPTNTWQSPSAPEEGEATMEKEHSDSPRKRRNSKVDMSASPEKRERQDKLTDLHSKYGLMDELEHLSEDNKSEDSLQDTQAEDADLKDDAVRMESSTHRKSHISKVDDEGKMRFEVTVNKDETNVLYNVEKTEYKTYTLRDRESSVTDDSSCPPIPDTININLTKTTTHQRENRSETITKERILFQGHERNEDNEDGVIVIERKFAGKHTLDFEQDRKGDMVSRESSSERRVTDEDSNTSLRIKDVHNLDVDAQSSLASTETLLTQSSDNAQTGSLDNCRATAHIEMTSSTSTSGTRNNSEQRGSNSPGQVSLDEVVKEHPVKVDPNSHESRQLEGSSLEVTLKSHNSGVGGGGVPRKERKDDDTACVNVTRTITISSRPNADGPGTEIAVQKDVSTNEQQVTHSSYSHSSLRQTTPMVTVQADQQIAGSSNINVVYENDTMKESNSSVTRLESCGYTSNANVYLSSDLHKSDNEKSTRTGFTDKDSLDLDTEYSAVATISESDGGTSSGIHTEGDGRTTHHPELVEKNQQHRNVASVAEITLQTMSRLPHPSQENVANAQRIPCNQQLNNSSEVSLPQNGQNVNAESVSTEYCATALSVDAMPGHADAISTSLSPASVSPLFYSSQSLTSDCSSEQLSGRLTIKSDSSVRTSTADDTFYSPDSTIRSISSSSGSSDYRTPQQSPREFTSPKLAMPPESDQTYQQPVPFLEMAPREEMPGSASSSVVHDREDGDDMTFPNNQDGSDRSSLLSAMAAAVGRQLLGDEGEMEAMREMLKQEVERKIARLQRRVRSLSDSAISSDFTEPESTSVSPRTSRIPFMDGNVESLASEATFYTTTFSQSPQEMFLASKDETDSPQFPLHVNERRKEMLLGKSLEDSGNIHEDRWQDTWTDMLKEESTQGIDIPKQGRHTVQKYLMPQAINYGQNLTINNAVYHAESSSPPGSQGQGQQKLSPPYEKVQKYSGLPKDRYFMPPASGRQSCATLQSTKSHNGSSPASTKHVDLRSLPGQFPERVVDAVLSLEQAWPPPAYASQMLSPRRKGFLQRRTKSLNNLAELAAAQNRSNLEENLLEQARRIMQVARVPSGTDLTINRRPFGNSSGGESVFDHDGVAVEWVDGHFHPTKGQQASFIPHHPQTPSEGISRAWLVSAEKGVLENSSADFSADDQRLHDARGLQNRFVARSISDQPERYTRISGLSDSEEKQMQLASWVSNWDSASPASNQHSFEPSALSVSGTTSEFGSSTAPSLSDTADENIEQGHLYHPQSCDRDSNSLLTSGELEIAGINANAAIRKIHADVNPSQFSTTQTSHSYKDTRIDARSSARSSDTASDFSSPRRWNLKRCRRLKPRSSSSSMRERRFSPGELVLPERTVEWLQHARVGLHEDETLDDLLRSSTCEELDSPEWTTGQLNMLQCKAMSITNLGQGRYMGEDDEQELSAWEMNRPASLACLEGLVMEDSSEDVDSSSDSICIVFMDQRSAETAAQLRAFGGSFTTSEGSERVISHSQSTDSISRCGHLEKFMPPLSEHSASLNNIYEAIASNVQRKGQLHRSRSASLLDVGATPVCEDDLDENIFPPSVSADSQTSLEKATNALVAAELSSHGACLDSRPIYADGSMSVTACIKQVLAYSESDVERTEQYLSMSSPPELHSNRWTGYTKSPHTQSSAEAAGLCQTSQEDRTRQRSDFMVVESDQPYVRYRLPDTELQQSERGAQTEKEVSPRFYRHSISNDQPLIDSVNQQAGCVSPVKRSQSTGSLETLQLNSGETSPVSIQQRRLPLSPKSKEWVELSHLMLETTHILQNLQQTFPPQPASRWSSDGSHASPDHLPASPPASHDVGASSVMPTETGDQRIEFAQTVETETRSSSLHSEQITTQHYPTRWSDSCITEESDAPNIKVESVITHTGPPLEKLMTAESGPHTKLMDARARLSMSEIRLETVEASSSAERTSLAEMTSQMDDLGADQNTSQIRSTGTVTDDLNFGNVPSQSDQTFVQVLDHSDMDRRSEKINSQNVRCQTDDDVYHLRGTDENLENQRTVEITCHAEVDVPAQDDRLMKDVDRNENTQYLNMECQTDDLSMNSSVHEMRTDTRYRMEDISSTDVQDKTDTVIETYILKQTTMNGIELKEQTMADSTCQTEGVFKEKAFSLSRDSGSHLKEHVVADNSCQTEELSLYHSVPGMKDGSSSTVDDFSSADFTCQADRTVLDHYASRNLKKSRSTADAALDSADFAIQTDQIDTEHRISKDTRDTSSSPIDVASLSDSTCQTDETNAESPVSKELMESACNTEGLQSSEMMCQTDETPAEGAVLKAVKDASSSMANTEVADTTSQTDQLADVPEQTLITDTSFKTLSTVSLDVVCQTDDVEYGAHRSTKDATSSMEDLQSTEISCQTDDTYIEVLTPQMSRDGGAAVYDASVARTTNQTDRNLPTAASLEQLSEDVSTRVGNTSQIEDSGYNSSIKVKPDDDSDSEETYFFEETYVIETYNHPAVAQTETSEAESTNQPVLKQKETYETESTSQPEITGSSKKKRDTIITDTETTVTTNTVTHTDDHTPESHKRRTEKIDSETTVVTLSQTDRPNRERETKDASSGTTSPLHTSPQTIEIKQDAYDESTVTTNTWIQIQRPSTIDTTCQTEQSDGLEEQLMNQKTAGQSKTAGSRNLADRLQMSEITSQTEMYPEDTLVAKDSRNASSSMESVQTSEKTSQTDVDVRKTKDVSSNVQVDVREFTSQTDAVERNRSTPRSRENKDAEVSTTEHKQLTESVCQTDEVLPQWSEHREVDYHLCEESKASAEMPTQTEKDAYSLQQEEMKNAESQTLNRSFSNAVCQTDTETLSQDGGSVETITNTESQVPSSFSETSSVTKSVVRSKELQGSFEKVPMDECACQTDSLLQENGIPNDLSESSPAQDDKHKKDMVNTTCQTEEASQILSSNMTDENDQKHRIPFNIQSEIVSDVYKTKTFDTEDRQYWYDSMSSDEYSEETTEFSTEPRQKPVSVCTQLSQDYPSLCIAVHDKDLGDNDDSDDVLSSLQLSPYEDGLQDRVDTEDRHAAYQNISAHLPLEMLEDDARVHAETALLEQEHSRAYQQAEPRHAGVEQSDPMTPVSACVHDYVKSVTAGWAQSGPGAVVDSKEQELDSDTSAINTPVAEDLRREVPVGGQIDHLDIEMLQSESGGQMTVALGPTTVFDHQNQPLTPGSDSQDLARQNKCENPSARVASYQRHLTEQTLSRMSNRKIPEGSPRLSEKKKGEFTESGTLPSMVDSLTTDEDEEHLAEDSTGSLSRGEEVDASSIAGEEYALPFTDAPNVTISHRFTVYEHSWESDSPSTTEIGEHSALSLIPGPEITTQSHVLVDSSSQALPQSEISTVYNLPYSSLQNTNNGSEDLSKDSQESFPQTEKTVFEKNAEPTSVMKADASSQITSSVSVTSGPLSQTVSESRQSTDQEMHKQAEELNTSTEGSTSEFTGQQDAPVARQLQTENDPTLETAESVTTSWFMSGPSVFVDSPVSKSSNQEMHKQADDQDVSTEDGSSKSTGQQDAPVTRQLKAENDPTLETEDSATISCTMFGPSVFVDSPVSNRLSSDQDMHKQAEDQGASTEGGSSKSTGQQDIPVIRQLEVENDPTLETEDSVTTSWTMSGPSVFVSSPVDNTVPSNQEMHKQAENQDAISEASSSKLTGQQDAPATRQLKAKNDPTLETTDSVTTSWTMSGPRVFVDSPVSKSSNQEMHTRAENQYVSTEGSVSRLADQQDAPVARQLKAENDPTLKTTDSVTTSWTMSGPSVFVDSSVGDISAHTAEFVSVQHGETKQIETESSESLPENQRTFPESGDVETVSRDHYDASGEKSKPRDEAIHLTRRKEETNALYDSRNRVDELNLEEQLADITEIEYQESVPYFLTQVSNIGSQQQVEREMSYKQENSEGTVDTSHTSNVITIESGPSFTTHATSTSAASAGQEITVDDQDDRKGDLTSNAGLRKKSDLRYLTRLEGETKATQDRTKRTTELNPEDQMATTERERNISSDDSDEEAEGELSYRRDEKIEETREIIHQDRYMVLESGPSVTAHTPAYKATADQEITTNDEDSYGNLPERAKSKKRNREYRGIPDSDKKKGGELSFKRDETVEESTDVICMESTKTVEKGPAVGADSTFPGETSVDPAVSPEQDQHRYRQREHCRNTERDPESVEDVEGELTFKRDEKIEKTHDTIRPERGRRVDDKPIIIVRSTSPVEKDTDEAAENDSNEEEFVNRSKKSRRRDGGELSYYRHDTMEERPRPRLAVLTLHGERQLPASTVDDVLSPEPQEERSEYPIANLSDTNRLSPYSASETTRYLDSTLYVRELPEVPLPRQSDIMNEIEKLREEHNRMMLLLERSRHHPSPLLNRLYRARSASPCLMHGGSWSSSSSSPVTVIAGIGSVRGSPVTFISSQSPRLPISGLVTGSGEESRENAFHGSGLKRHSIATTTVEDSVDLTMGGEWQPTLTHSTLPGFMLTTSTPDLRSESHLGESDGIPLSSSSNMGSVIRPLPVYGHVDNTSSQKEHRLSVTHTTDSSAVHKELSKQSPRNTQAQPTDAQTDVKEEKTKRSFTVHNTSPRGRSISEHQSRTDERFSTDERRSYHLSEYRSVMSYDFVDNLFVRAEDIEMSQPPLDTRHDSSIVGIQPSYSTARKDDNTSIMASPRSDFHQQDHDCIVSQIVSSFQGNYDAVSSLHESFIDDDITPDFLIQTPRSLGGENVPPLDHQLAASPSLISKGVEAVVNSSDDFTQTDGEDDSLHLSLMDTSRSSLMSSGTTETYRIRAELDRLHQERVEIIELLSLKYLPGSLTVELLEAKLNYCLGQTDMLLASLEKAWAEEEPSDLSRQWSKKHEELLSEYRQQFQQSRQDIKVCMEEARRMQHGTRGRRVARTRDLIAMKRRAQIEAFKHERKREQDWYDRHRNISPDLSDSRTDAGSSSKFAPRFMTPRQHKEHLVRLRRSVVAASTEELDRLRRLSHSSSVSPSPDRSVSPASNVFQSRESSLSSSLSPDRPPPSSNLNSQISISFSNPSLLTPAAYSSTELQSTTAHSSSSLHVSPSPPRAPTQMPPTEPMHYRGPSIPRHPKSYLAPRSSSCGPAVSRHVVIPPLVAPPLGHQGAPPSGHQVGLPLGHQERLTEASPLSGSRDSLDPEQLLQESYAARQLNRQQISKAHEALKLLEEHRHGFHSQIRSQERRRPRRQNPRDVMYLPTHTSTRFSEQVIQQEIANLQQQRMQSPEESTALDSGVMSFSLQESVNSNVPPDSTSTPRTHESFESYSTGAAMQTERHVQITLTRDTTLHATEIVRHEQDTSFERSEVSTSDTPSSLLSTDLDSFLDLSTSSSLQQSSSHFTSSRPISSQDIKARIARRAKEKATKGKE